MCFIKALKKEPTLQGLTYNKPETKLGAPFCSCYYINSILVRSIIAQMGLQLLVKMTFNNHSWHLINQSRYSIN